MTSTINSSDYHTLPPEKLVASFGVDPNKGWNEEQVQKQREKFGRNEFPRDEGTPLWEMILEQFKDQLVLILLAAAFVSFVLAFLEEGENSAHAFVEPLVIILILIANATVGVLQESSAEKAVEALKAYDTDFAAVIRGGEIVNLDAADLVPGDIVEIESGNRIPADIRVIELQSKVFDVDQSLLTGETNAVYKTADPVKKVEAILQDKLNILFSGTTCVRGKCKGIVIGTGLNTEKGKIRDKLKEKKEEKMPLKERLDAFGDVLSKAIGLICVVVWLVNISHFWDPAFGGPLRGAIFYFKIAVSLAVAAIPEGLPAIVTTCLALGTQRMAKKNAIVTSLPAVETLGCTNVICSDKTGTLTTNQMAVQRFFLFDLSENLVEFEVEGTTYAPVKIQNNQNQEKFKVSTNGKFVENSQILTQFPSGVDLAAIFAIVNDSSIIFQKDKFDKIGQSTEAALKVLVEKLETNDLSFNKKLSDSSPNERASACSKFWSEKYEKISTLEFNRDRKSMSVLVQDKKTKKHRLFVKGAWDSVLARCDKIQVGEKIVPLTSQLRSKIEKTIEAYCTGENSFRCLVAAFVDSPDVHGIVESKDSEEFVKFESHMTFVGTVGIFDPPREEVKEAIFRCKRAGIDVIVITGDNLNTAAAICRKIGVFSANEDISQKAYTGEQFKQMSQEEKLACVLRSRLFARVEPVDKEQLVKCLHVHRKIVAMTGDGVNDSIALKQADIGVAMGSGTSVAKGAAKMILADDNFNTIVSAVEEGRSIYNNTKQFIRYLICSNIGEVVSIAVTAIFGLPDVLLPVQLLWVNLVTDSLPAISLGFNKPEEGIMEQSPRSRDDPIVSGWSFFRYLVGGTYIGLATIYGAIWWFTSYSQGPHLSFSQLSEWHTCVGTLTGTQISCEIFENPIPSTISLSILVIIEMFCAFNSLSEKHSLLSKHSHPFTNFYLIAAVFLSVSLHFMILYVPFLAKVFSIHPISWDIWVFVVAISFPIVLIDETLKFVDRNFRNQRKLKVD